MNSNSTENERAAEQVPDELFAIARAAFSAPYDHDDMTVSEVLDLRSALAAVLAVHEQQVREQVAKEIEALAVEQWDIVNSTPGVKDGEALPPAGPYTRAHTYDKAAKVARGTAR